MRSGYLRYFIGFIITFGLIIALIILIFSGNSGTASKLPTPRLLSSYADTGSVATMTIDGPITANSTHTTIRVSVDRNSVTYQQLVGYDGTVVKSKSYDNTTNSYSAFLRALAHAGYNLGITNPAITNPTGYCPLGSIYTFMLKDQGIDVYDFWTSSCGSPKTYKGNTNLTIQLFRSQVPDYGQLIDGIYF